jgi:hypothetical protein
MVMAQDTTPAPRRPRRKKGPGQEEVVLNPPAAAVVKSANVNLRGRASFKGKPWAICKRATR